MKHFLILLTLTFAIGQVSAQKPWKWSQLGGPNVGSHKLSLMFDENNDIIAVGPLGYFLSTNNGATWDYHSVIEKRDLPCNAYYSSSPYGGKYSGLFIAPSGEYYFYFRSCNPSDSDAIGVYRSTDKGNTWKQVLKDYFGFQMASGKNNSLLLFAGSRENKFYLFESLDKGNSWTELSEPQSYEFQIVGSNDNYIYAISGGSNNLYGNLQRLSYANLTWENFSMGSGSYVYGVFAQLRSNLFISFDATALYTSDGENSPNKIGFVQGLVSITKGNGDSIYAAIESPDYHELSIDLSTNFGASWQHFAAVSPFSYTAAYYAAWALNYQNSDQLLFENDTALYSSVDKGNTWKEIGLPADSIDQILLTPEGRIFSEDAPFTPDNGGGYPTDKNINVSDDKGQTWHTSNPGYSQINKIGRGVDDNILAIAPDASNNVNSVWLFDASSKTKWTKRSSVQEISSSSLIASDRIKYTYLASNGYYSEPVIYRSDDNAFSWVDVEAPNTANEISALDVSSDGTVYFGSYPVMYRSDDHGITWTKLLPANDIVKLTSIKTFGASSVLLGTEGDGLLLSPDKGNTWTRIDGKNFDTVTCIGITSIGEIAAGTPHGLWLSDSAKRNWSKVTLGHQSTLHIGAIEVSDVDDFYIGTYGSSIWEGTRHYNAVRSPQNSNGALRISPNPASDRITIDIDVPYESSMKLELYDVLGRKIAVVAEGIYSGNNQISFMTTSLSRGIYTCRLSGVKNETVKFILR